MISILIQRSSYNSSWQDCVLSRFQFRPTTAMSFAMLTGSNTRSTSLAQCYGRARKTSVYCTMLVLTFLQTTKAMLNTLRSWITRAHTQSRSERFLLEPGSSPLDALADTWG